MRNDRVSSLTVLFLLSLALARCGVVQENDSQSKRNAEKSTAVSPSLIRKVDLSNPWIASGIGVVMVSKNLQLTQSTQQNGNDLIANATGSYRLDETVIGSIDSVNEVLCFLSQAGYGDERVANKGPYLVEWNYDKCTFLAESRRKSFAGEKVSTVIDVRRESPESPLDARIWVNSATTARLQIFEGISKSNVFGVFHLQYQNIAGTLGQKVYLEAKSADNDSPSTLFFTGSNSAGLTSQMTMSFKISDGSTFGTTNIIVKRNQSPGLAPLNARQSLVYDHNRMLIYDAITDKSSCQTPSAPNDAEAGVCNGLAKESALAPPPLNSFQESFAVTEPSPEVSKLKTLFKDGVYVVP